MCICKLVVSISFLKPPIFGAIWVTRTDTDGYFYHPSVALIHSHTFTQCSRRVLFHLTSFAYSIIIMMMIIVITTNTLRMRIHFSIQHSHQFDLHVYADVYPIRFMVFPRLLVIYFIIILCFMISIRSN